MNKKKKTPMNQNKKRHRQQKADHNAPEEISRAQAQWQAEQLQHYTRRARTCANADDGHALWREAWDKRYSVPKTSFAIIRILRKRFTGPMNTPDNPHHDTLSVPVTFRNISIIAPMGPHDTPRSRRINRKLYLVLREFLYTRLLPRDLFSIDARFPALPHGGQCLQSQCTESPESFLDSASFQDLIRKLKAERLTPCLYVFHGYSGGHSKKMVTVDITDYNCRKVLHWSDIEPGKGLKRCYDELGFALCPQKKAQECMKNQQVDSIECSAES